MLDLLTKYFPDLNEKQLTQFASLKDLYIEWNKKINVISRKDMENFYEHHVLHSLSIANRFSFPDGYEIMDLGTGGGFPAIPLAIYFPRVGFRLVDSINKKLKVAGEVATAIGLSNVTTMHIRAEDIRGQQFDVITSRAVAPLKDLLYWSKPLLKKQTGPANNFHGLICLKGGDLSIEIAECNCRPQMFNIDEMFKEAYFKEKYILAIKA